MGIPFRPPTPKSTLQLNFEEVILQWKNSNDESARACDDYWSDAPATTKEWIADTFASVSTGFEGAVMVVALDEESDFIIGSYTQRSREYRLGAPFDATSDEVLALMTSLGPNSRVVGSGWDGKRKLTERQIMPCQGGRSRSRRHAHVLLEMMVVAGYLTTTDNPEARPATPEEFIKAIKK